MNKPYLLLNRFLSDSKHTIGTLTIMDGNTPVCILKTLELPWKGNKVNVSSIPNGVYECTHEIHPTRGWVIRVHEVPNRSGVLIHMGNYLRDTNGCILPGLYHNDFDNNGIQNVAYSRVSMETLRYYMKEHNSFKLIIV